MSETQNPIRASEEEKPSSSRASGRATTIRLSSGFSSPAPPPPPPTPPTPPSQIPDPDAGRMEEKEGGGGGGGGEEEEEAEEEIAIAGPSPAVLVAKGNAARRAGRWDEALRFYVDAKEKDPNMAVAWHGYAAALGGRQDGDGFSFRSQFRSGSNGTIQRSDKNFGPTVEEEIRCLHAPLKSTQTTPTLPREICGLAVC